MVSSMPGAGGARGNSDDDGHQQIDPAQAVPASAELESKSRMTAAPTLASDRGSADVEKRIRARIYPLNPTEWKETDKVRICVFDWHSEQTMDRFIRQRITKNVGEWGPERGRFAVMAMKPATAVGETVWFAHDIDRLIALLLERAGEFPAHEEIDFQIDSPAARQALIGTLDLLSSVAGRMLLAKARLRSIFIATPIARQPVHQYTLALALTLVRLQALGIRATVQFVVGSSNLAKARNQLAAAFMASDYDDLLFIDDDIGFAPNDVVRLLGSDKDLIAGVYCKKTLSTVLPDTHPAKWMIGTLPSPLNEDEMGAIEVEALGTGFMKISRAVFSRLKIAHPEWKRRGLSIPEHERAEYYQYFRFDPNDHNEQGEDVAFCHAWRDLGGTVWVDPAIKLVHVCEHEFTGNFEVILQMLRTAKAEDR
jgi:hypothetical protein